MVAVDHTHMVCCITHNSGKFVPGYTGDGGATGWKFCGGLPARDWMLRGYNYGATSRPFAVGYGADLGTVWACETNLGRTATLWRSIDAGANFTSVATFPFSVSCTGMTVLSVPGYPNELWISGQFTGGGPTALWHVTNANSDQPTVTLKNNPRGQGLSYCLTMGAPASQGGYPTLYLLCYATYGANRYLYQGDYDRSRDSITWTLMAHPNGNNRDLPLVNQVAGFQSIRGSWNRYQRLLVPTGQSGFAYYNP
jgi:hypothetical protein